VWIAWGDGDARYSRRFQFSGDRDAVRRQTVEAALQGLLRLLVEENPAAG